MKKGIILILFIISLFVLFFSRFFSNNNSFISPLSKNKTIPSSIGFKGARNQNFNTFLFVPYWSVNAKTIPVSDFDTILYFGIAPNYSGIDKKEQGFLKLSEFMSDTAKSKKRLLVVRMIDQKLNSDLLSKTELQSTIASESANIAQKNGFDGLVLDFEINALAFDSVVSDISAFYREFARKTKSVGLSFYITMYGDLFYRARPYDLKTIAKDTDGVLVMTYDLFKANGDPGPNFPLFGKETYGYDLRSMLNDYTKVVSKEKLTVVFGLFGYDWSVDSKNSSLDLAKSYSLTQINETFLKNCSFKNCKVVREEQTKQEKIEYRDAANRKHIVWFEDKQSIEQKKEYLKKQGVASYGYWAYSYF